jgi:hypothetical protein
VSIEGIFITEGDFMKINPISMTNRSSKAKYATKVNLDTDIKVIRIQSHAEKLDTFVNTYGEKEMKRLGIIACDTCLKRVYKDAFESNPNRRVSGDVFICSECGRSYDDKGIVNITKFKINDYESKTKLFEGLKLDEKI